MPSRTALCTRPCQGHVNAYMPKYASEPRAISLTSQLQVCVCCTAQPAKQATPASSAKKGRPTPQQQAPQRLARGSSQDTNPASQVTPAAPDRLHVPQPGAKIALASAFDASLGAASQSGALPRMWHFRLLSLRCVLLKVEILLLSCTAQKMRYKEKGMGSSL